MSKGAGSGDGEQFYVTHCTTADSVLNNPGYSVRAASTTDSAALSSALRYPPYELPMPLWQKLPAARATSAFATWQTVLRS